MYPNSRSSMILAAAPQAGASPEVSYDDLLAMYNQSGKPPMKPLNIVAQGNDSGQANIPVDWANMVPPKAGAGEAPADQIAQAVWQHGSNRPQMPAPQAGQPDFALDPQIKAAMDSGLMPASGREAYYDGLAKRQVMAQLDNERRQSMYGSTPTGAGAALQGAQSQRPTLDWFMSQVPQQYDISQGKSVYDFGRLQAALSAFNEQEKLRILEQNDMMRSMSDRDKNDLLRQQINEKYDPQTLRTQHAIDVMKQNPNANAQQVISQVDRMSEILQGMNAKPGQQQAAPSGIPGLDSNRPNPISVERQRRGTVGPEIYDLLSHQTKPEETNAYMEKALTDLFRYDQRNPGYMQRVGPEVMEMIKRNYGEGALNNFMNPGALQNGVEGFAGLFGPYDDVAKARASMRHYMGYGKPLPLAARYNPGQYLLGPQVAGQIDSLFKPHQGIAPIPGSPGALLR